MRFNIFRKMSTVQSGSVEHNLNIVKEKISQAYLKSGRTDGRPRLVAVSKTKPVEMIVEAYGTGQRVFGENYVKELVEKSHDSVIVEKCPDIKWHYIGRLQESSIHKLVSARNLAVVETLTSDQLASKLYKRWKQAHPAERLEVMVQVNTSREPQKSGVYPDQAVKLAEYILQNCAGLKFLGFMTIGELSNSVQTETSENPDFLSLRQVRDAYLLKAKDCTDLVELSMGMSSDFEQAILMGSTNVRIGSTIFGARL